METSGNDGSSEELSPELIKALSWDDFVRLTCMFERWANDYRHDPYYRARFLEKADTMRTYVNALPYDWRPTPPKGKRSILKFLADRERTLFTNGKDMDHTR